MKYLLILDKNKNIAYITFNDYFSGIYISQVLDVLNFYGKNNINIRLITFVSVRFYFSEKRKIKKYYNRTLVIPIFFRLKYWRFSRFILFFLIYKSKIVFCRGIFSANIALISKRKKCKIIYDGRGAISAEQNEYGVYNNTGLENKIHALEKRAVLNSDYRISVSSELLKYWHKEYGYNSTNHVIIPSCSSKKLTFKNAPEDFGFNKQDIIIVFSGSISKWHSFSVMISHFEIFLKKNENVKILILSKLNDLISDLRSKYPNRVIVKWVSSEVVPSLLSLADYGYVFREQSVTNKVASPVKVAEYLSCGLKVLISKNLGDYSEIIEKNDLGRIIDDDFDFKVDKVSQPKKDEIIKFLINNLSLQSTRITNLYMQLINENLPTYK